MLARLHSLRVRFLPHGPVDLFRQIALFACAYYAYRIVRGWVDDPGGAAEAFDNARDLIDIERTLNVFVEPSVQTWAAASPAILDFASWMYINAQTTVTLGALAYLYLFHNRSFYFVRNMFMVAWILALIGYVVYPTAPPRFMPEWGFFDAVSEFTGVQHDSVTVNALFNPYAAVPSMHICFAIMISVPIARLARHRVTRVVWTLYPLLVLFVVVATGNHFVADAFLGAVTAVIAAAAAKLLARTRPAVWAFAPSPSKVATTA
jgi:PAP2 superfamily